MMSKQWWDEFWRDPLVAHLVRQDIPKVFIDTFKDEDVKDKFGDGAEIYKVSYFSRQPEVL